MSTCQIIRQPNTLAQKVGPRMRVFTASVLRKAELIMDHMASKFEGWLEADIAALVQARAELGTDAVSTEKLKALARCGRHLKGSGAAFGYPIVSRIGESLCVLTAHDSAWPKDRVTLLDAHIDAIKAAVRDGIRNLDDPVANETCRALELRTREMLR